MLKFYSHKVLIALLFTFYILYAVTEKHFLSNVIKSDGEGYYSYLPAVFLYKDNTYGKCVEVKQKHYEYIDHYRIKTDTGKIKNKYFAGVSFVAAPAFFVVTGLAKFFGYPTDGYHSFYMAGMYLFSVLFMLLGFYYYIYLLQREYAFRPNQKWLFVVVALATPWLFSAIYMAYFANTIAITLLVLAYGLILHLSRNPNSNSSFYGLAFLCGVVAIVRPTALVFLVLLPYFFTSWKSFVTYFLKKITDPKSLLFALILFFIPVCYQLFLWKWETGHYFLWSYSGEGFNWFSPRLFEVIFGFRNGILFHSPVLIVCFIIAIVRWKTDRMRSAIYLLYFVLLTYVSAAWWCWDFETRMGLRNYTEQYVFLLLPLFSYARDFRLSRGWIIALSICTILPFIRFNQYVFGYNVQQRYTAESYFKSLIAWRASDKGRWTYSQSTCPYGKRASREEYFQNVSVNLTPEDLYFCTIEKEDLIQSGERVFVQVEFDRDFDLHDQELYLVMDQYSSENTARFYETIRPAMDRKKRREHVKISAFLVDNLDEYDRYKIYFWNPDGITGKIDNLTISVEKYVPSR